MAGVRTVRAEWRRLPPAVEKHAFEANRDLRRPVATDDLFLLALAQLDETSPARQVLDAEGVTADVLRANIRTRGDGA